MVHPGRCDPARAGAAGALRARRTRRMARARRASSRRGHKCYTTCSQTELPPWSHARRQRRFPACAEHGGPGREAGPFIRHQGGCGLARLLITLGMRDAAGAAAVDARGSVPVSARTRRGAAGAVTASSWAAGRRWVILLALGWLVQVGLRVWFSRQQVMPLANPDETAYLVAARVLAGGPAADLSGSTLYPGGYPLLITPVVLVQQQSLDRLPRRAGDQRRDQRPGAAARLPGLPQARARPPGRVRRGVRGGARPRRVLLQRVRDDQRGLRGDHAGLAADHA